MKYAEFRGLAEKICITNFKRNKLPFWDACFFSTKRKTSKFQTKVNNVYLNELTH